MDQQTLPISVQLGIARYNESIDWLHSYSQGCEAMIYNKGDDDLSAEGLPVIALPNVGREAHTYLHHIIHNYGTLADVTVFLQGCINDLYGAVHARAQDYVAEALQYGFCAGRYWVYAPHDWKDIDFEADPKYQQAWRSGALQASPLRLIDFATTHLGPLPLLTTVSLYGCFAASRAAIQRRPISFYQALLERLVDTKNPAEGHYLERLWCYMFSANALLTKVINLQPELQGHFRI